MNAFSRQNLIGRCFLLKMLVLSVLGLLAVSLAYASCVNCNQSVAGCWQQTTTVSFRCCVDNDGDEVYHCADCLRTAYFCGEGLMMWGPPFNCTNPGGTCTP